MNQNARGIIRAAALGAAIAVTLVTLIVVRYVMLDHLSERRLWQIRLTFLITLELVLVVVVVGTALAIPTLGLLVHRARKRGQTRPLAPRVLLLCVSVLLILVVADAVAGAWMRQVHRMSALRVGGQTGSEASIASPELPASAERITLPTTFEEDSDGAVEIVVVGESSAAGVPYDWWLSIGTMLIWKLESTLPGRRFHYTCVARPGVTLETQHMELRNLRRRPDVLVIYAGHNEFSARFPWSREVPYYHDRAALGFWAALAQTVRNASGLDGMIREEIDKCRVALPPPPWATRSLVDEPVYTPEEWDLLLDDFGRRLDAMVAYARQIHAEPILIPPPANEFDFEPNRSCLPPETPRSERDAFASRFLTVKAREESDPSGCLEQYQAMLARYPGFAELHYRVARVLARLERWEDVYRHSVAARELDGFPERFPPAFQEVYRKAAARHRCTLIDAQKLFHQIGHHGLLDDHLFHDGLHPSLRGQIALTQAVLQALHDRGALGWPAGTPPPVIDPGECAERFHLTPWAWEKICNFGIMFYDLTSGLRYDPSERFARRNRFGQALEQIKAGLAPEAVGLPNVGVPQAVPPVPEAVSIPE